MELAVPPPQTFAEQIEQEFVLGSVIAPGLFRAAVVIIEDTGFWEPNFCLNQDVSIQWQTRQPHNYGSIAFFLQETGELWQGKPQNRKLRKDGSEPKYETPKGAGLEIYTPPIPVVIRHIISQRYGVVFRPDGSFWDYVEAHSEISIVVTEGGKKSLCLLSLGFVAVALYGVDCGSQKDEAGEHHLIPGLLRFCQPGREIIIAFDKDEKRTTRRRVNEAIIRVGNLLNAQGVTVRVGTWEAYQGKGIDDLHANCGAAAVEQTISSAVPFDTWQEKAERALQPGEPEPEEYQTYLQWEAEQKQIEQTQANEARINDIIAWIKKKPQKVPEWTFSPLPTADNSDVVQVKSHEEGHYLADQVEARLIVNVSETGSQKSSFYSRTTPDFFRTERMIVALPNSLNPSVQDLERLAHLEGRHLGNIQDLNGKLRRAKFDTSDIQKVTPANCDKADAIEKMSDRNPVNPASMLACLNCQHNWRCGKESGNGYGARQQTSIALKQPRFRLSYARLHGQGEEVALLTNAALILDESSSNISQTKTIKVKQQDIKDKYFQIDRSGEPSLQQFKPLLTYLMTDAWRMINRNYGAPKAHLIPLMKPYIPKQIDWEALEQLEGEDEELKTFGLKSDVEPLSKSEKQRLKKLKSLKWLPPDEQQEFYQLDSLAKRSKDQHKRWLAYRKYALTKELEQEREELQKRHNASKRECLSASEMRTKATFLNKRWLRDFLLVMTSNTYGHAHWGGEGVTVTLPNSQHLEAIQCAKKVVLSDASELRSKSKLSKKYGIPTEEIFIFEVKQPKGADVEIVLVTGLGKLGRNRGESLEKCRQALVAKFKEIDPTHVTFDSKYFKADGVLFRDTVGSNDYKHCKSISTTLPRPSINALLAEYCVLNKTTVDEADKGFQQFYKEHVAQGLKQIRGRFREQLRPGDKLTLYILADENIPITGDRIVAASDICPDAARKGAKTVQVLVEAAKWVLKQGLKLTQSAVARASLSLGFHDGKGYTQQHVSKHWGEILDKLQLFLDVDSKKSCSPNTCEGDKVDALVPVIEKAVQTAQIDDLDEVLSWFSSDEWAIAFKLLSDSAKEKLVKCWASMLPVAWLEAIGNLSPPPHATEEVRAVSQVISPLSWRESCDDNKDFLTAEPGDYSSKGTCIINQP